jgi:tetratricopeptide (TPR) repeat protein
MKKVVLLLSAIVITIGVEAQRGKVNSALNFIEQGSLDKAKENLDEAVKHAKSKDWPKTYYALGRLAMASFESENSKFKNFFKNPLIEAYEAYEKSMELDDKDAMKRLLQVNNTYAVLGNMFINLAVQEFQNENYRGALDAFKYNIKISETDVYIGMVDTGIIYNAGLAAYNGKFYEEAIEYFEMCTESGYEGTAPYTLMYYSYIGLEDLDNALNVLNRAFNKYPGDQDVLLVLIQHYLDHDQTEEGLESVAVAIEKDPENPSLHLAEGVFYMKLENYAKAVEALEKSVELNPEDFATQLNLGICYYNLAFEKYLESNEIMDVKKYNEAVEQVNEMFKKALPPFETAHKLNPEDIDTMKNLRELYYRLQMEEKYQEINKKLEGKL